MEKAAFYENLIVDANENCTEKEKIVGHYLSKNLKEPRHPAEVFFQLKRLAAANKGEFTEVHVQHSHLMPGQERMESAMPTV